MGKLLGIDYGERKIGIALSDEGQEFAFPHIIIENDKNLIGRILDICTKESVERIILGESLTYTGGENLIMKKITRFKEELEKAVQLPVVFETETLTSQEAKRIQSENDEKPVDDSAAALILQSHLDKKREIKNG